MSKNKYESLARSTKPAPQERPEPVEVQPDPRPDSEAQAPKGRDPTRLVLLFFAIPVVLIGLSTLFRNACL